MSPRASRPAIGGREGEGGKLEALVEGPEQFQRRWTLHVQTLMLIYVGSIVLESAVKQITRGRFKRTSAFLAG